MNCQGWVGKLSTEGAPAVWIKGKTAVLLSDGGAPLGHTGGNDDRVFCQTKRYGSRNGDRPKQNCKVIALCLRCTLQAAGILKGLLAATERRSEERRVGKECRSRWSPYH